MPRQLNQCASSWNRDYTLKYPFSPFFKTIKATNPDFRFDNIDIVIYRCTLADLFETVVRNDSLAERFTFFRFRLLGNTLFISGSEQSWHHQFWNQPSLYCALRYLVSTEPQKCLHRAVKYDLGGLTCIVVSEYDAVHSDQSSSPVTVEVSLSTPDYTHPVSYHWLGRCEYLIRTNSAQPLFSERMWIRDTKFETTTSLLEE